MGRKARSLPRSKIGIFEGNGSRAPNKEVRTPTRPLYCARVHYDRRLPLSSLKEASKGRLSIGQHGGSWYGRLQPVRRMLMCGLLFGTLASSSLAGGSLDGDKGRSSGEFSLYENSNNLKTGHTDVER